MTNRRIGLFGGSYDPPHVGHLVAASQAVERERLDRLLFLPAGRSPFKSKAPVASAEDRLAMLRLAVGDDPRFGVDDREIRRPPPSYTVDTLRSLHQESGAGTAYVLLIGVDALAGFPDWRESAEILRLASLAVVPRPGATFPELELRRALPAAEVERLRAVAASGIRVELSSTDVRSRIGEGRSIRYLVPREVEQYIVERRLYVSRGQASSGTGTGKG